MTSTTSRIALIFLGALLALTGWGLVAHTADSTNAMTVSEGDVVMGQDSAPVLMLEYASMTCGHCADFHTKVLPEIKKNYIDTGKIKFVLRDMPWDPLALAVSKISRCAPADKFYNFSTAFFEMQPVWTKSSDPVAELKKVARLGGMDGETVEACLNDADLHARVIKSREVGMETLRITSTPTFFIGGDVVVRGNVGYAEMAKAIERALRRAE